MAKKKKNKMYANDPQASRYQAPRSVYEKKGGVVQLRNIEDTKKYKIRNPERDKYIAKKLTDKEIEKELRQEKMYGRAILPHEKEI
tara:strand:- start:189 stop:446 length:258 start_codon:yes stop_codon:yes gene_type:complete